VIEPVEIVETSAVNSAQGESHVRSGVVKLSGRHDRGGVPTRLNRASVVSFGLGRIVPENS